VSGAVTDIAEALRSELRGDIGRLDTKLDTLRTELRGEMQAMRGELRGDMQAARTELRGEMQATRNELHDGISRLDAKIDSRFDQLGSRIDSKLPSWWQMSLVIDSTVTLLAALYAAAQFLRLHGWWPT
jgi:hypothetical protein